MSICFEFGVKRVLITQGCFRCCWAQLTQSQEIFCLSLHPTSEQAGGAQGFEKGHSWDSQHQVAQGCCCLSHTIWYHAQRLIQKKEEVKGDIWSDDICLPKSALHVVDPWFPGGGWTFVSIGSDKGIPFFALPVAVCKSRFCFIYKTLFQPTSFLTCTLLILFPS